MEDVLSRLAVVVPVGPGDTLQDTLRMQLSKLPGEAQVCVACCEQPTRLAIAETLQSTTGPRWLCVYSPPGRALQQNTGAIATDRHWLWFLHSDSVLAADTLPALARWLAREGDAVGYFDLRFLDDGPALMPINTFGAWLRSRVLRLPFGDQGLLLPRALFDRLGGFDETLSGGEDHALVWQARRAGVPLRPLRAPLYTSARKYAERGWMATTTRHLHETWRQARQFSRTTRPQ